MTAYLKPSLFSNPSLPTIPSLSSFGRSVSPNPGKLPYDLSPDPGSTPQPSPHPSAAQPRAIMPLFNASSAKNAAAGAWKGISNSIGVASGRDEDEVGGGGGGGPAARHHVARESSSVGARIKCSDCGVEVSLDELLEHVCAPTPMGYRAAGAQKPPSPPRQQIRVEIPRQREFSNRGYPQTPNGQPRTQVSLTPPGYFPSFKPGEVIPTSMTRSGSSTSLNSAGSGRMPFFEKYAQQVAGPSSAGDGTTTWGAGAASSPTLSRFRQPPSAPVRHHIPQSASNGSSLSSLSSASPSTSSERDASSAATSPGDEFPDHRALKQAALAKGVPLAGRRLDAAQRQPPHPRPDLPLPSMPSRPGLPSHPTDTTTRGRLYPGGSANGVACRAPVSTLPARGKPLSGASRYRRPIPTAESPKDPESPMSSGGLGLSNVLTPHDEPTVRLDVAIPATSPSHSRSSSLSDQYQGVGLEGLMGDLMAAMDPSEESSNGDQDIIDFAAAYADRTPRPGDVSVMPSTSHKRSPGDVHPDDSISQRDPLRSPSVITAASAPSLDPSRCHRCRKAFPPNATSKEKLVRPVSERGRSVVSFCRPCYADLYLPKCRRCEQPIEKGAVTDRVGKVLGKYHPRCFTCVECSERFETGEFYVWERNPVCYRHYHQLAGTTCCNEVCGQGIEGPCVALSLSEHTPSSSDDTPLRNSDTRRLYHPEHFTCSKLRCGGSLHEYHFLVGGKPWCERHAVEEEERQAAEEEKRRRAAGGKATAGANGVARRGTEKAKKRRTVVMNVRGK